MSELTKFRDHARAMSSSEHSQECQKAQAIAKDHWSHFRLFREWPEKWGERPNGPPEPCPGGCVSESDRDLWSRLATEIDEYLEPQPDLFGDLSTEPAAHPTHTDTESE